EVRIRVEAAGVNFAEVMGRMGMYPDLPALPVVVGYEVAGHVDAAGRGVYPDWVGRRVLALTRFGGYSDVVCVSERQVFTRPEAMGPDEGAALPVNYLTAYQLVEAMGGLRAGDTVLIHSAWCGACSPAGRSAAPSPARTRRCASSASSTASTPAPRTSRRACARSPRAAASSWCSTRWVARRSRRATARSPRPAAWACSGSRR